MTGRLLPRDALSAVDEVAMYSLLQSQFQGLSWERFQTDLDSKNWVVLLDDKPGGRLCGLSTFALYDVELGDRRLSVVCSGDTVVDPSAWRRNLLSYFWIGAINHLRQASCRGRLYWLLIASGYRTYRFLPVFWREFFPRYDFETPADKQKLIDALARDRYGANYLRNCGIVRFFDPQILKGELRGIPPWRLADPHVAFFAEKNPGHEAGDELVCLTELERGNLTAAGVRMWNRGRALFADSVALT